MMRLHVTARRSDGQTFTVIGRDAWALREPVAIVAVAGDTEAA